MMGLGITNIFFNKKTQEANNVLEINNLLLGAAKRSIRLFTIKIIY